MTEVTVPKIYTTKTIGGVDLLANITTPAGPLSLQAGFVTNAVDQGREFWYFASVPTGQVVGCDFTGAPVASSTGTFDERKAINLAAMQTITVDPEDVLTYA